VCSSCCGWFSVCEVNGYKRWDSTFDHPVDSCTVGAHKLFYGGNVVRPLPFGEPLLHCGVGLDKAFSYFVVYDHVLSPVMCLLAGFGRPNNSSLPHKTSGVQRIPKSFLMFRLFRLCWYGCAGLRDFDALWSICARASRGRTAYCCSLLYSGLFLAGSTVSAEPIRCYHNGYVDSEGPHWAQYRSRPPYPLARAGVGNSLAPDRKITLRYKANRRRGPITTSARPTRMRFLGAPAPSHAQSTASRITILASFRIPPR